MADEALASWLCRLASMLGMSAHTFVRHAFGIDSRGDAHWWRRPSREHLATIGQKTGVSAKRLGHMTLAGWSSARSDERQGRWSAHYVHQPSVKQPNDRFIAVCPRCLAEDKHAYIRRSWMIGWLAACPRHRSVLTSRCPACAKDLRIGDLSSRDAIVLHGCHRCGAPWSRFTPRSAIQPAIELQEQLLNLKRHGAGDLPGIGPVDWGTLTVIADLISAAVWEDTADHRRERLFSRIVCDLGMQADERLLIKWQSNYGTLLILAWAIPDWPTRLEQMLGDLRALSVASLLELLPEVDTADRQRLPSLLGSACGYQRQASDLEHWREWLDAMVASGMDFRARARRMFHQGYYDRLGVFARLAEGDSIEQAAAGVGLKPATVEGWIETAMTYGIHMVIEKALRLNQLTPQQVSDIRQWLTRADVNLTNRNGWRADHARHEIARQFGINVSVGAVQLLLPS
ncbi:hypothetical protein GO615_26995 [Aromatoleum evansii]|nr:hypothetical protein [Aromatoleum evansii]